MRKNFAAATVAAASVLGLGAGFAFGAPALVGAQTDTSSTTATTTATTAPPQSAPAAKAPDPARVDYVKQALDKLVKDATITQAQADAVAKAITDARPARGARGPGDSGKIGKGGFGFGAGMGVVDAAAKALNMTRDDLIKQVVSGSTVAKIAESKGVALNTVVSAVVTELSSKIDAAVTAGKLTQAQADAIKATLTKNVTDFANGTAPTGMPGFGMPGMPGMPGFGMPGMPGMPGFGMPDMPGMPGFGMPGMHGGRGDHAPGADTPTTTAPTRS